MLKTHELGGLSTPQAPKAGVDEKALKAIKKEGGKKGAEIAGAADMGGMEFMNVHF